MNSTAGPFLRYINCLPGSTEWRGSVLFLTKQPAGTAAGAAPAGAPGAAVPPSTGRSDAGAKGEQPGANAAPDASPVLALDDGGAGGGGASEVQPLLLDTVHGWMFWRFDLALRLGQHERSVRYAVRHSGNAEAGATFWLPAAGRPFHWGYYSCNGFSLATPEDSFARKDPTYLWRDLLQVHGAFPMHAIVGGGDQVYADSVWEEPAMAAWGKLESHEAKLAAAWTEAHEQQATAAYLRVYLESFTMADVATAYASIPYVMVWDDHDIWDGYGSYDPDLQACPMFRGTFDAARRFYLLFQQHTTEAHNAAHPEFLQVAEGYHKIRYMGPQVVVLCVDMRTRRSAAQIMPESTYQLLRNAALELPDTVQHVVVMSGVPVVFPEIPFSEAFLRLFKSAAQGNSCCMAFGRQIGLFDRFDQPEILDDITDGWAANIHHDERLSFVHLLQEVAATKGVRVTILSGDAHVGGVGRLYTRKLPRLDPKEDPLFMAQIISSAIMNAPPPAGIVGMLSRTNTAQNLDHRTRQKMVRAFWPKHPRTDKLLRRRNWCDVCMLAPPYAAPNNPLDPECGGLRFALRVEDPTLWKGYAEEVYDIVVPRAPPAARAAWGAGGSPKPELKGLA